MARAARRAGADGPGREEATTRTSCWPSRSKDDDAAQKFVDARRRRGRTETYRDVKYQYKASDDLAAAVVNHVVLVGTDKAFKSAVDAQSGAKLADAGAFKSARDAVGTDGLGFLYADPLKFFNLFAGAASGSLSPGNAQGLRVVQQLLAGVRAAVGRGVAERRQGRGAGRRGGGRAEGRRGEGRERRRRPGRRGGGPGGVVAEPRDRRRRRCRQERAEERRGSGVTGGMDPATLLDGLKSQLGIDVQKDLLSWMGDAALFVRGTTKSTLSGALVVHSKDPAASRRRCRRSGSC